MVQDGLWFDFLSWFKYERKLENFIYILSPMSHSSYSFNHLQSCFFFFLPFHFVAQISFHFFFCFFKCSLSFFIFLEKPFLASSTNRNRLRKLLSVDRFDRIGLGPSPPTLILTNSAKNNNQPWFRAPFDSDLELFRSFLNWASWRRGTVEWEKMRLELGQRLCLICFFLVV